MPHPDGSAHEQRVIGTILRYSVYTLHVAETVLLFLGKSRYDFRIRAYLSIIPGNPGDMNGNFSVIQEASERMSS